MRTDGRSSVATKRGLASACRVVAVGYLILSPFLCQ